MRNKKIPVLFLVLSIIMPIMINFTLPTVAIGNNATDVGDMNALDAIGIDTSELPEGVDLDSIDNPYGRDTVTINPVYELFVQRPSFGTLYGHNKKVGATWEDFNNEQSVQKLNVTTQDYAATATASGNFIKDSTGGKGQTVTVATGALSSKGGLYLYFSDPAADAKSASEKTLLDITKTIGNTGNQMDEDFSSDAYLMQNYLQVSTGDYDGDGVDEIAVYVPQQGSSRVEIYKLQIDDTFNEDNASTYFLDTSRWAKEWTYYFNESPYVSNMVSLNSGDFNRDGIDDLALTWGYYYGHDKFTDSKAVILCGSKTSMLQESKTIDLKYDNTQIVRAAFTYGDIDGDNINDLILGGQLNKDISKGNLYSRFMAVYTYDGESDNFIQSVAQNFDLFSKEENDAGEEVYVYPVMATHDDIFYSLPAMVTNIAAVNMRGVGYASNVYIDSLIIEYGDNGLDIIAALDRDKRFNYYVDTEYPFWLRDNEGRYYTEYSVVSGDFTGNGAQSLQVMLHYSKEDYHTKLQFKIPYYQSWWHKLFRIKDYYTLDVEDEFSLPATTGMVALKGELREEKEDGVVTGYNFDIETEFTVVDFPTSFCKLNSDNDTSYISYTGEHGVIYSDPKVLAVLASAPYFEDLSSDSLSGSYMESSTAYSSTEGTGSEETTAHTLSIGGYVSYERDFEVFGVKVAGMETELAYTHGWTWETTDSSMVEMTISYETVVGQDSVVFYSIPMEFYLYDSYVPIIDESTGEVTGYDKQKMSVNLPHTAAVVVLPLEKYEKIAADYEELPQIAGKAITHVVGNPSTYPGSSEGYANAQEYSGNWAGVDYSASGASVTQEIAITEENSSGFSQTNTVEFKIGAGPGNFIFGVTAGYEHGFDKVTVTSEGSTYSGTIYNMPAEAEEYGYYYAWKLFTYTYNIQGTDVPVVNYMVKDVTQPPFLPKDFRQDSELTTDDSIGLVWSYPSTSAISGFQIYRYYMFPDGSGSYELAFVPASDVSYTTMDSDNRLIRHYKYVDRGLADYTDYDYQIQVVRAAVPTSCILSDVLTARTKADKGYPSITLEGVTANITDIYDEETGDVIDSIITDYSLLVYPDTNSKVSVSIAESYSQTPRYQWQKRTDSGWEDIAGATKYEYTFSSSGASVEGEYRCRLNAIYEDEQVGQIYYISAYSDIFTVNYSMRKPKLVDDSFAVDISKETVSLSLKSNHTNHTFAPSGNVTFAIRGADYDATYTVALGKADSNYVTRAVLDLGAIDRDNDGVCVNLPAGVYEITAYYSGSRVFSSLDVPGIVYYVSGNGSGYLLNVDSSFKYGDTIEPKLMDISLEDGLVKATEQKTGVSYKAYKETPIVHEIKYTVPYKFLGIIMWYRTYTYTYTTYEYVECPVFIRPDGSVTARHAGNYKLKAYVGDVEVAVRDITVAQKDITIGFKHSLSGVAGNESVTQPTYNDLKVITDDGLVDTYGDTLENLGLVVKAYNTAGTEVTLNPDTSPGLYTIVGAAGNPSENYYNYNITYVPTTYILTGPKYDMTIVSDRYGSDDAIVGTVAIITPEVKTDAGDVMVMETTATNDTWYGDDIFTGGTAIVLRAKPQLGYKVKSWTVETENKVTTTETPITTFTHQTTSNDTTITVEYEIAKNRLFFKSANNSVNDGTVVAVGNAIESGAVVQPNAKYTFVATPAEGYHFVEWTLMGSTNSNFTGDYDENTGTSTTMFTMGNVDTILSAVFKRNDYVLRLQSSLQATYEVDDGFGNPVTKTSFGIVNIKGGTFVTITPKTGYSLVENSTWYVNEEPVGMGLTSYTFTIAEDTTIDVGTSQNTYDVSVSVSQPETTVNNKVISRINNAITDFSETRAVSGGSTLTFTAVPAWGYVFDHWKVNGEDSGVNGKILSIAELGEEKLVEAVFKENENSYAINISNNSGGKLSYSVIYNEQGYSANAPEDAEVNPNGTNVSVYEGDTVVITANSDTNYMLRSWTVGNQVDELPEGILILEDISENITVSARFIPMSFTTVTYSAGSDGGSIVSAKSNGVSFESGSDIGNGSRIEIKAQPDAAQMVSYWTIGTKGDEEDLPIDYEVVMTEDNTAFIGETLIIQQLAVGSNVEIKVHFEELSEHAVNYDLNNVTVSKIYTPADYSYKSESVDTTDYVKDGSKIMITAEPENGYRITEFTVAGEKGSENENGSWSYTINQVTEDIDVIAIAEELYTISISDEIKNGGIEITTEKDEGQAIEGETIKLESVNPDTDYTFVGWSYNGTDIDGTEFIMPDEDITVFADFTEIDTVDISYGVYDTNDDEEGGTNGTISATVSRTNNMGQSLDGYPYTDSDGRLTVNRGYMDEYVDWPNSKITFKAKPDKGYMVKYWYIDDEEVVADTSVYELGLNTLTLTVKEDAPDSYDLQVQYDVVGDKITYLAANAYGSITSSVLTSVYGEDTEISSGDILTASGIITFTAEPINDDYKVEGWYVNDSRQKGENGTTYQYDATAGIGAVIAVNFERVSYFVEYDSENGDVTAEIDNISIGNNSAEVVGDSIVVFTANAHPGYAFNSWKVNGKTSSESTNILTLCIKEDTIVTAIFEESENCTVTYGVAGIGGTLTATRNGKPFTSGSFAAANDIITFTAKPESVEKGNENNYRVASWEVDGEVIHNNNLTYKLTVNKAATISVSFERSDYVVDYAANGKEKGNIYAQTNSINIKSMDRVEAGNSITFTAEPASGYLVKSWTIDGVTTETESNTYTIDELLDDTIVRVEFEKKPAYTITVTTGGAGYGTVTAYIDGTATEIPNANQIAVPHHGKVTLTAVRYDANNAFNGWTVPVNAACIAQPNGIVLTLTDVMGDITVSAAFMPVTMIELSAFENDDNGTLDFKQVQVGYLSAGLMNKVDLSTSSGIQITKGMDVVIRALPNSDYMLNQWIVNGVTKNELSKTLTLKGVSEDTEIEVTFEPLIEHSIPNSGTQINGEYYTVTPGLKIPSDVGGETEIRDRGTVTFTVKANNGCYFTDLEICGVDCLKQVGSPQGTDQNIVSVAVGQDASYNITVANVKDDIDCTIKAVKPIINIEEPTNGTIAVTYLDGNNKRQTVVTGSEIPVGTKLTAVATPTAGYYLKQWGNDAALQKGEEINIIVSQKQSIIISAEFEQPTVTVLVPAKGSIIVTSTDEIGNTIELADTNNASGADRVTFIIPVGTKLNVNAIPDEGYKFKAWSDAVANKKGTSITVMVPGKDITISASFNMPNIGGGGSGGGGMALPPDNPPTTDDNITSKVITNNDGTATIITKITKNVTVSGNTATVSLNDSMAKTIAEKIREAQQKALSKEVDNNIVINSTTESLITQTTIEMPNSLLNFISGESSATMTISTNTADFTLDQTALSTIAKGASGGKVTFKVEKVDREKLPQQVQQDIGDALVLDLTVEGVSGKVSDFAGGTATVRIPIPQDMINKEMRVVFIADDGTIEKVTGHVITVNGVEYYEFATGHFSYYALIADTSLRFVDVSENDWYYKAIAYVQSKGLMAGTTSEKFEPNATTTRAMLVTVLWRMAGEPNADGNSFVDVDSDAWYSRAVSWSAEKGIVKGIGGGLFAPAGNITREQVATVLHNYASFMNYDVSVPTKTVQFSDIEKVSSWAKDSIEWAANVQLISGKDGGILDPLGTATRAEVATILMRFIENIIQ